MGKTQNNATANKYDFATLKKSVKVLSGFGLYDDMSAWTRNDTSVNRFLSPNKNCDYTTLRRVKGKVFDSRNLVSIRFNKSSVQLMFNAKHSEIATKYESLATVNPHFKKQALTHYTVTSGDYSVIESILCDCCRYEDGIAIDSETTATADAESVAK